MGCSNSNEVAPPVFLPMSNPISKMQSQAKPIDATSLPIGDAYVVKIKDQQNQTMGMVLRQLSFQNELILKMQRQRQQQRLAQQQRFQQMRNEMKWQIMKEKQEEKRRQQGRSLEKIEKRSIIDIPKKYKNIGKETASKYNVVCNICEPYLPKFLDYQPGLKKCACKGAGIILNENHSKKFLKCQKCSYPKGDVFLTEVCSSCYGYGVLNQ